MSTRGVIAKPVGDGWTGVYHGDAAHPMALGLDLLDAYETHFGSDHETMIRGIIDEHPEADELMTCTCTPGKSAPKWQPPPCAPLFTEFAYVITKAGLVVYTNACTLSLDEQMAALKNNGDPAYGWHHIPRGLVPWGDHEAMRTVLEPADS